MRVMNFFVPCRTIVRAIEWIEPTQRAKSFAIVSEHRVLTPENARFRSVNGSQPIYTALALHSFQAQSNRCETNRSAGTSVDRRGLRSFRELSFKKGETILVKRSINDDWLEGELHGLTGIFPVNYVELFPYETPERELDDAHGEAVVKYDYRPQKPFELQLSKVSRRACLTIRIDVTRSLPG